MVWTQNSPLRNTEAVSKHNDSCSCSFTSFPRLLEKLGSRWFPPILHSRSVHFLDAVQTYSIHVFQSLTWSPLRSQSMVCKNGKVHPRAVAFLFHSSPVLPFSSHTAYPATFGTGFSLLGFSHLGQWHKINEDTQKTQGSELEGLGGWGVKLLECKIALAAVLLFQHFILSCSAWLSLHYSEPCIHLFHLFSHPHLTSVELDLRSVGAILLCNNCAVW